MDNRINFINVIDRFFFLAKTSKVIHNLKVSKRVINDGPFVSIINYTNFVIIIKKQDKTNNVHGVY